MKKMVKTIPRPQSSCLYDVPYTCSLSPGSESRDSVYTTTVYM